MRMHHNGKILPYSLNGKILTPSESINWMAMQVETYEIICNINFYRLCTDNNIEQLVYNTVKPLKNIADSEKKQFAQCLADFAKDYKN